MRSRLPFLGTIIAFPSTADVSTYYYADQAHVVEVGAYHPAGVTTNAPDPPAPEVSFSLGRTDVLVNSDPNGEIPETGGCIDILVETILDSGCGAVTITPDGVMGTTRIVGDIDSIAYEYISEPYSMTEIGPSVIHLDLTFTGMGDVAPDPGSDPVLVGVCGLPPDTRGASVISSVRMQRPASVAGTLTSDAAGAIDPTPLQATMAELRFIYGQACVE